MSAQHELTSESLNIDSKNFAEIESHEEVQYTWNNETSDDATEMLIGQKRLREDSEEAKFSSSKRAKIDSNDSSDSYHKDEEGHPRRKPGQIAGAKFTKVLKQGQQIAHWLSAKCLPQDSFCRSHNKAALSFECKNDHKFYLNID